MAPLPKGSLVLVTGANGWIASHTVDQLLQAGYNVRGTSRAEFKITWLKEYVEKTYGPGRFEIAIVPDMADAGSFTAAVKGVSAIFHMASDLSFGDDPTKVVTPVIKGMEMVLEAAESEPSVKHFVYTSSAAAAFTSIPDKKFEVDENTWNDESIDLAWSLPAGSPMKGLHCYSASKAAAERALWKRTKESKLHFIVNAVLPNMTIGPLFDAKEQSRTSGKLVPDFYTQGWEGLGFFKDIAPQHHVDVRDSARLHIAPLLDDSIQNERIFAFNEPFTWNQVLDILRKARPNHDFPENSDDSRQNLVVILPRDRSDAILKKNFDGRGLYSLVDSVEASIAHLK